MNKILESCAVLSPELGTVLIVGAIYHYKPQWLTAVCTTVLAHPDASTVAVISLLGGLLVGTYRMAERLRRPVPDRLALRGWRDYRRLNVVIRIAYLWIVCSIVIVLVGFILVGKQEFGAGGALVLGGVGVSCVSCFSTAYAVHIEEDIIEEME